jgi:hypothetical protein
MVILHNNSGMKDYNLRHDIRWRNTMMTNNRLKETILTGVFRIFVLSLLCLPFLTGFSHAETLMPDGLVIKGKFLPGKGLSIGKVYSVQADVIVIHADRKCGYRAKKDIPLFEGDTIITQDKGRIEAVLNDGSAIILVPQTSIELSGSVYDQANGIRSSLINMALGKARFLVTKLTDFKRSDFKVKTETAIAGVRGSDFIVKASPGFTEIAALAKTRLEVASTLSPDKLTILSDYERTFVEKGALPSPVVKIPDEEINRIQNEFQASPGSRLSEGSVIINKFSGNNVTNIAIGKGSEANLGTVRVKGSNIKGAVINDTTATNASNIAAGTDTKANTGSVVLE